MPYIEATLPRLWRSLACLAGMPLFPCAADITTDGSVGPSTSLLGPDFQVISDLGQRAGGNLFHSFGRFNLNAAESGTFTGPTGIENVLARVTGGSASNIDGLIRTRFENASPNLFFLNPAGIVFGPNAQLDVQGSFHASTADYLRFDDGTLFFTDATKDSVLSVAAPQAFGFLSHAPGSIAVTGDVLPVLEGETVSLIGGDITMKNGTVYAPGGQINLISTASPGEVTPTLSGPKLEANVTSTELGKIILSRVDTFSERPIGDVDVSGAGGGAVVIRGGELVMEGALVLALTFEATEGVGVDIRVSNLDMRSLHQDIPALISTDAFGVGDGGDAFVETDTLRLTGAGFCEMCDPTGIYAQTNGDGDAGNIKVKARQINLETFSFLSASSFAQGEGGDLDVEAGTITLDDAFFTAQSEGGGSAGNLNIAAVDLTLINGAEIRSATFGPGRGGDISIQADRIFLSGNHSFITSQSAPGATGDAGEIQVTARHLEVRNGAQINALTAGLGQGGNMFVTADDILLVGDPSILFTGLSNESRGDGDAGDLTVTAGTLEIRDNARIEASTLFDPELTGISQFSGQGGNITVTADDISISGEGAGIVAKSTNRNPAATSGNIHVTAHDSIRLQNGGTIGVETVLADAGDIDIQANELLLLRNEGSITTSVAGGTGSGGNIRIDPVFTILDSGSRIVAQAREGAGGNIHIVSDFFFASPDSVISASSELGIDGVVEIESPDTDLIAGLVELPADFFDVATLLTQGCAPGADLSRLVVRKYEVLPDSPAALRVPPAGGLLGADAPNDGVALIGEGPWLGAKHLSSCEGNR